MSEWIADTTCSDETAGLGRELGRLLDRPATVFLNGDLGTGKTCFVQGLARGLGVPAEEPVTSPSYSLMNHFQGRLDLYHFDLYRLSRTAELDDLGLEEYFDGTGVAVVEWADRFSFQDPEALKVDFERLGPDRRRLTFHTRSGFFQTVLQRLAENWSARTGCHD